MSNVACLVGYTDWGWLINLIGEDNGADTRIVLFRIGPLWHGLHLAETRVWVDVKILECSSNYEPGKIAFREHVNRRNLWMNPISSSGSSGLSLPRTFALLCSEIAHTPRRIPYFLSPVHSTLQLLMHVLAAALLLYIFLKESSLCSCVSVFFFLGGLSKRWMMEKRVSCL